MKTITLGRIFSTFAVGIALLGCPALTRASSAPVAAQVVPMGNNTFSITQTATNGFRRDTEKLEADVKADAEKYCAAQGKQLKVVDLTSKMPFFATGYASAKIVFQALTAAEIEQAAAVAPAEAARPSGTVNLYSDLIKLDELRQKGILTDDEFQAEKKKILARSK